MKAHFVVQTQEHLKEIVLVHVLSRKISYTGFLTEHNIIKYQVVIVTK